MKPVIATLFSGGGILEARLKGLVEHAYAVEYDPAIAGVYRANFGHSPIVARVQDVDPLRLERPDWLHASPVCKEFSSAKTGGKESAEEISQAEAVCNFIRVQQPRFFTLENVRGYVKSKSFSKIVVLLTRLGYQVKVSVINMADYGVPQTRERLILRAVKDGPGTNIPGAADRWVGWYEAIEDLIPTLPESKFADWQLERLPGEVCQFLMESKFPGRNMLEMYRVENRPTGTVTSVNPNWKAFLIPGDNASNETVRMADEPMVTVRTRPTTQCPARAFLVDGQSNSETVGLTGWSALQPANTVSGTAYKGLARAWLSQGRVVQMTPRALARFQSIPDWYELPEKNSLACTVIGNGVASLFGLRLFESFYGAREEAA